MSLGHFEAGGGWEAQIRQYVRKKYREDLAGLAGLDPNALAGLFRGELLPGRPYATIRWVLRVAPFRPLELFLLFDLDPEFGTDLRVFYARKSLVVPTEDAYVFAWDYVALLARYGRGKFSLENSGPGTEWLPFADFAPDGASPMQDVSLGAPGRDPGEGDPRGGGGGRPADGLRQFRPGRRGLGGDLAPFGRPVFPVQIRLGRLRDGLRQSWGPEIRPGISHELRLALYQRAPEGVPPGGRRAPKLSRYF